MVDGRHTLLFDTEDIDDITPCLFAHRDDVVGVACRCPVLLAVEHTVDGLVELRVADERQVVYRDHRPDALGTVQPDGELVGQAVEEVDLLVTAARRHGEVAPDIPTCEGQSTVRRDETHRAMRQQTLVECRVARGRGEKEIAVLRSELRERVQHEATVIAEASGIVRNALGIEGDIHRRSEATKGRMKGEGTILPRSCSGRGGRRARLPRRSSQRRCTSSCSSQRGQPSSPSAKRRSD